jgi:hypothetical protein
LSLFCCSPLVPFSQAWRNAAGAFFFGDWRPLLRLAWVVGRIDVSDAAHKSSGLLTLTAHEDWPTRRLDSKQEVGKVAELALTQTWKVFLLAAFIIVVGIGLVEVTRIRAPMATDNLEAPSR